MIDAAPPLAAAIAAQRFGLGEASLAGIGSEPQGWLLRQIGPADVARGEGLFSTPQAMALVRAETRKRREARQASAGATPEQVQAALANPALTNHYRDVIAADQRSRLLTAVTTARPFAERLQWFWANHFTVSLTKGSVRGLVGAFERDAIRPRIAGTFEQLLWASSTHPAMLRYLDNHLSAGPHSRVVARAARRAQQMQESPRVTGLNENLAREILELHTLGVNGGYTQSDVTAFAAVLTGWRPRADEDDGDGAAFDPNWHEPGPKTVLGRRYPEGPDALAQVLADLARHPSTARFIATKLARHFCSDDPPAALVDRLAASYRDNGGQLDALYRTLVRSPEPWAAGTGKLKSPEEFVVSSTRVLNLVEQATARMADRGPLVNQLYGGVVALGQRPQAAPSPAGWPDRAEDWLGPDAVWKRIEWATRAADRTGRSVDARALAGASLGAALSEATRQQIDRAADGPQALALLLMAPEFQRR